MSAFEVLTMGRVGVDLYPQQVGVHLEDVETFAKYLGGSATKGVLAHDRTIAIEVPPVPVNVLNGLGAGAAELLAEGPREDIHA
jgi:hypothetical protein